METFCIPLLFKTVSPKLCGMLCPFSHNNSCSTLLNSLPGYHCAEISQTYIFSKPQSMGYLFTLNKINIFIFITDKYYENQR